MSLYPYNYYILYISISLTIIALIKFFLKTIKFNKHLILFIKKISKSQQEFITINDKTILIKNRFFKFINSFKKALPFLLFGYYLQKNYQLSDKKGLKRLNSSVNQTVFKDIPRLSKIAITSKLL